VGSSPIARFDRVRGNGCDCANINCNAPAPPIQAMPAESSCRESLYCSEIKSRDNFQSVAHFGPMSCADFEEITDRDERELRARDAFERVNDLLLKLTGV
jgi:hypothetical protein